MRGMVNDKKNEIREHYLGIGVALGTCFGVAMGAGLGVAFGNLALGIGIGLAIGMCFGIAIGAILSNKRANAAAAPSRTASRRDA
jgi:hypothetical protein